MPLPAFEAPADPREPKLALWAEPAPGIQGRTGEAEDPRANSQLWGCPGLHIRSLRKVIKLLFLRPLKDLRDVVTKWATGSRGCLWSRAGRALPCSGSRVWLWS